MLPNRHSEDPGLLFWALISVERIQSLPHLPPWAQVDPPGLPKAKDLGGAGPDGPVPGTRPPPGAGAPGRGGRAGSGQLVLTPKERPTFPDGWWKESLMPAGPEKVDNCDFFSFHSMH